MTYDQHTNAADNQKRLSAQQSGSETAPAPTAAQLVPAAPEAPAKSKGGAPAGNRNSYRHGLYSPRGAKGTLYVDRAANQFRRHLEDQVLAAHGEISTLAASLIQTAAEASRVALAELTELRELTESDSIKPAERSAKRQAALKALDLRDRKVKELGITWQPNTGPAHDADPWRALDEERKLAAPLGELADDKPPATPATASGDEAAQCADPAPESLPCFPEKPTAGIPANDEGSDPQ